MTYRHAAKASGRWPAEAATATLGRPTSTRPTRWATATRAPKRASASAATAVISASASSS